MDELDESVGGDYLEMIKGQAMRKKDLGTFLRYARYMRNKNYVKLENLYK